jgi:hypothetical protein
MYAANDTGRYIYIYIYSDRCKKNEYELWEIYGSVKFEEEKRERREDTYTD